MINIEKNNFLELMEFFKFLNEPSFILSKTTTFFIFFFVTNKSVK